MPRRCVVMGWGCTHFDGPRRGEAPPEGDEIIGANLGLVKAGSELVMRPEVPVSRFSRNVTTCLSSSEYHAS